MKHAVLTWTIVSVALWATSLLLRFSGVWYFTAILAALSSGFLVYKILSEKNNSIATVTPDTWERFRALHPEIPADPEEFLEMVEATKEKQREDKAGLLKQEWLSEFNFFINAQDGIEDLFHGYFSRLATLSNAKHGVALVKPEVVFSTSDKLLIAGAYGVSFKFLEEHDSEGITHQALKEQREITLSSIPSAFLNINSGLGGSSPSYIWIIPMNAYENTLGVIELAFFSEPEDQVKQQVRQSVILLAVRLQNIILKTHSEELLQESKQRALELEKHQQILQSNFLELQAKEDQLEKFNGEIQAHRSMLISILNEIPMKVFIKQNNGKFYVVNKAVSEFHDMTVDELIGKSDFDLYPQELAKEWFEAEQAILHNGKKEFITEDHSKFLYTVKMPFYLDPLKEMGLLGYQMDITETERLKRELEKRKK